MRAATRSASPASAAARLFRCVYALLDSVPEPMCEAYVRRLERAVEPGGRLIVDDYGSLSQSIPPRPVDEIPASYRVGATGAPARVATLP